MDYADYLLLLPPPEGIIDKIRTYKNFIVKETGSFNSMNTKAHITISETSRQKKFMVRPALDIAERKIMNLPPVTLQIDGFNFFIHGETFATIYADIKHTYVSDKWFELLRKDLYVKGSFTPHITVARHIPVDTFYKVWPFFRHEKYVDVFEIDRLTILERETFGSSRKWLKYKDVMFRNKVKIDNMQSIA